MQFVAIAIITSGDAIEHLANHKEPENGFLIIIFAVITMVVLGAIGAMKLYINRHLHSKALEQVRKISSKKVGSGSQRFSAFIAAEHVAYRLSARKLYINSHLRSKVLERTCFLHMIDPVATGAVRLHNCCARSGVVLHNSQCNAHPRADSSLSLLQDAMASFATAAISVGLLVSASAHAANDNVWWLVRLLLSLKSTPQPHVPCAALAANAQHMWSLPLAVHPQCVLLMTADVNVSGGCS